MNGNIWISRGTSHDARFLAAIDRTALEAADSQERLAYWQQFEFAQHPEPANVLVARIGGLYAAYIALHANGEFEQRVQPRFQETQISSMLLERAGIQLEPAAPEGMAVA
jgi:hypothetical protein